MPLELGRILSDLVQQAMEPHVIRKLRQMHVAIRGGADLQSGLSARELQVIITRSQGEARSLSAPPSLAKASFLSFASGAGMPIANCYSHGCHVPTPLPLFDETSAFDRAFDSTFTSS